MEQAAPSELREKAIQRIKRKSEFKAHLLAYVLVNILLVAVWATVAEQGLFWPIFPIAGWGIGLAFHAWYAYESEPSEEAIRREMQKLS